MKNTLISCDVDVNGKKVRSIYEQVLFYRTHNKRC